MGFQDGITKAYGWAHKLSSWTSSSPRSNTALTCANQPMSRCICCCNLVAPREKDGTMGGAVKNLHALYLLCAMGHRTVSLVPSCGFGNLQILDPARAADDA